jgi:hypothetical protein
VEIISALTLLLVPVEPLPFKQQVLFRALGAVAVEVVHHQEQVILDLQAIGISDLLIKVVPLLLQISSAFHKSPAQL